MNLPRLFKKTKTGAIQICDISIIKDVVQVTFGQLDGKLQHKHTTCYPKNVGRSNETSGSEQAILEANAKHLKKIKSGYSLSIEEPSGVLLPMKVKVYQENLNNVIFPCMVMTKYNGVNGTYTNLSLTSRGGLDYNTIPHLEPEINELLSILDTTSLGGELFIPNTHLQDITSAVKKRKALSAQLEFRVFSMPDSNKTFEEVCNLLNKAPSQRFVKPCRSILVNSHEEIEVLHSKAVDLGHEGIVIYNLNGAYEYNTRSSNAFKFKIMKDAEFKVVGHEIDKLGHVVYSCLTENNLKFKVKRRGTKEERLEDAKLPTRNYGKWLTVFYETRSKDNKPLKPIGGDFRECNSKGEPIE